MKTLTVIECRTCGASYYSGTKRISIEPLEDLELIVRSTNHCEQCKLQEDRSSGAKNKRRLKDNKEWFD